MKIISNFPFFELEFNKNAALVHPNQVTEILSEISAQAITDLIIISHGWNNDMAEARQLYEEMLKNLEIERKSKNLPKKAIAVIGVLWPSKKFADKEFIPGGAAALEVSNNNEVVKATENLSNFFTASDANQHLETIKRVMKKEQTVNADQEDLYDALKKLFAPINLNDNQAEGDEIENFNAYDIEHVLMKLSGDEEGEIAAPGAGGSAGVGSLTPVGDMGNAAGLGSWLKDGVFTLLNLGTYYQMKNRAGEIGKQGLNPIINEIKQASPNIKIHLIGHSFGARLVTSSILGENTGNAVDVQSLILLQAAFSHYGFAQNYIENKNGLFRDVIDKKHIKGVMAVSHSKNDMAVGYAYPLASRVAGQIASALGDENDKYGGLGRNGALKSGAIDTVPLTLNATYNFEKGKIYNLKADATISGHGDIGNQAVAQIISAIVG